MAGTVVKIKQSAVAGRVPTHSAGSTYIEQGELALNTADKKLYSKDGSGTIFEIGASSGGAAGANEIITTDFTATNAQTTFSVTYTYANDHVNVYYNGIKLSPDEYTATSGTTVVLDVGAVTGATISIEVIKALNLANGSDITEYEFTATASQTSFAISGGYNNASSNIEVYVNGVKIPSADFTATDDANVVLGTGAAVNDQVAIRVIKVTVLTATVSQTSDTGAAIIPAGTTAQRDGSPDAGYLRWNSTLSRAEVYSGSAWTDVGQQTLTTEEVQDALGPMLSGNTESGITVTYDDANNQIDFTVASQTANDFTNALKTKLDGIEASADVTDATNVNAAGALMLSDTTTAGLGIVVDEDNMSSDSATKVPTQQSVKAYVDTQVATVPVGDITSVVAGTGLTGGGTSGDVTVNVIGGTGITANADDIAIDSTVTTLTGTQTLTNKTINAATLGGTHTASSDLKISGTPTGITDSTLELHTTNSGWNRNQIMFSDSNDKVGSFSGSMDTAGNGDRYKTIQTLDPNNTKPGILTVDAGSFVTGMSYKITVVGNTSFTSIGAADNNVNTTFTATGAGSGTGKATITSYAGDHAIYFTKNYADATDTDGIRMEMNIWGSGSQGAIIGSYGDYTQGLGAGAAAYGVPVPLKINASKTQILNELMIEGPGAEASISMYEDETNGTNKIQIKVPASIASDGILTLPVATDTLVGKATTDTLTNKTLTSPVINTGVSGSAILDSDTMAGVSATTLASSESIKAYVDSQVTAQDLDFSADSGGALSIDLDSEAMTFSGGTGITTVGNANDVSIGIDSTVATLTGSQILTNKTLTTPVVNTKISIGDLEITPTALTQTATNGVLNAVTNGTGYFNYTTQVGLYVGNGSGSYISLTPTSVEAGTVTGLTKTTSNTVATVLKGFNHYNYDISGGLANGTGVAQFFGAKTQAGNTHAMGMNMFKIRDVTTSGSAGSSDISAYDSEYTFSISEKSAGSTSQTRNTITTNKDWTQLHNKLRIVDLALDSGSSNLSNAYLDYTGHATAAPTASIGLYQYSNTTDYPLIGLATTGISVTGNIAVTGTVDGRDVAADGTKLDGVEAAADVTDTANVVAALTAGTGVTIAGNGTIAVGPIALTTVQVAADQTAQLAATTQEGDVIVRSDEKKSYMRNSGSAGTMADFSELQSPEVTVLSVNGQTGAITAAQIATAVEAASDSNTFTDADHTKLNAIESSATADQTAAEIRTLVGSATDSNIFTDALISKLNAIEASADVTDATNVAAAGAVLESDASTALMGFVVDEDNMASNSATKLSTQQAIKAYVDAQIQTVPDAVAMAIALG